jgi:hypothetical protein
MGRIYEIQGANWLRCHDIHTKFHSDWFRHSKVNRGDAQTHTGGRSHKPTLGKQTKKRILRLYVSFKLKYRTSELTN